MAVYDIIMLVVIAGAIAFGYWKGFAWQVASLAAIIVSYFVALEFREPVAQYISADESWNGIAAMLVLFLGTSLVIWTVYAFVSKSLKKMELKGFDRQIGAVLGAVKGAVLCMVITMFSVSLLGEKAHDAIHNSRSGRYVVRGISQVSAIVPAELAQYIKPHVENFQEAIGHDGSLPLDQYPEHPSIFKQYQSAGTVQDPNGIPTYQGKWQIPSISNSSGSQQAGFQQPSNGQATGGGWFGNGSSATKGSSQINNGWPDVNFEVNSKQMLDAAADAARRAIDANQQR